MKSTNQRSGGTVFLALLLGVGPGWCAAQEGAAERQAEDILHAAGIQGGLIVHLGRGGGRLTAALGRSGRFVVRGLVLVKGTLFIAAGRRLLIACDDGSVRCLAGKRR